MQIRFTIPVCLILLNFLFPFWAKATGFPPFAEENNNSREDCLKDAKGDSPFDCISFSFIPPDLTLQCGQPPAQDAPIAIDGCCSSPSFAYAFEDDTIGSGCSYQILRTWTAISDCNNSASVVQTFTFVDAAAPEFVINHPMFGIENNGDTLSVSCDFNLFLGGGAVSVTDNCDPSPTVNIFDETRNGNCLVDGYAKLLFCYWIAEDFCSNRDTFSIFVRFIDTIPPQIECPPNIEIQCDLAADTSLTGSPVIHENCTDAGVSYSDDTSTISSCELIIKRFWTAEDACGNATSCTQQIHTFDLTPPQIICPPDKTIECDATTDPQNTGLAKATDNCAQNPAITFLDDSLQTTPCEWVITRTWEATDGCGNSSSCSQRITRTNLTPPEISCPADITIDCNQSSDPSFTGSVSATDNCGGELSFSFNDQAIEISICISQINRTWTATDACGNVSVCSQTIYIADTTSPTIVCPPDISIPCDASSEPANTGTPSLSDNCDANVNSSFQDEIVQFDNCTTLIHRTWKATDNCGNQSSCLQTITLFDTTTTTTISCPPDLTIDCNSPSDPGVTGKPLANDNCDPTPELTFADESTQLNDCERLITRNWTATDACGNSNTCVQRITIADISPPEISCPDDLTIECSASVDPQSIGFATASDACSGILEINFQDEISDSNSCQIAIKRLWTATDICGNAANCIQKITLIDSTAPILTPVNPMIANLENQDTLDMDCSNLSQLGAEDVVATDNCDANLIVQFSESTEITDCTIDGVQVVLTCRWTAGDVCGNQDAFTLVVRIIDNTPPELFGIPSDTLLLCASIPPPPEVIAKDACDGNPILEFNEHKDTTDPVSCKLIREWTATDQCGNTTVQSQIISVIDCDSCFSPNLVSFENFFVETIENRQVLLRWDFPKIGHPHLFAIQRSLDKVHFDDIGIVEGLVHFGLGKDHYVFHDEQARAGNNFYRIKSINATSQAVYSAVTKAEFEEAHATLALLYPNPVRGEATLEFVEKLEKEMQLKLTDRFGQILLQKSIPAATILETIDLKDFPDGIYFVTLLQKGKKSETHKLVKMN